MRKRIVFLSLMVLMLFCSVIIVVPAHANSSQMTADLLVDGNNVKISGSGLAPNSQVSLLVTRDSDGTRQYIDQIAADSEGNYLFVFALPEKGSYTAKIADSVQTKTLNFSVGETEPNTEPPVITVSGITDGATVNKAELKFTVTAVDKAGGKIIPVVKLNNKEVTGTDDNYTISLAEGENIIIIAAADTAGNKAVKEYKVTYNVRKESTGGGGGSSSSSKDSSSKDSSSSLPVEDEKEAEDIVDIINKPGDSTTVRFTDLGNCSWAREAIEALAEKGIICGKTPTMFDPDANITRAEFATLVVKMLKYEAADSIEIPFKDVGKGKWYYGSVAAAYQNGLMKGKAAEEFDPEGRITRQEMAVIIANVLKDKSKTAAEDAELNIFKDRADIAAWAKDSVALAVRENIIAGMGNGNFAPCENASRAQAAVMLYKLSMQLF